MKLSDDDLRGLANRYEGNSEIKALIDEAWEARSGRKTKERKHNHYFKPVRGLGHVDVYRVLLLFNVVDPCLQHAVKKLLVAGGRGGGKDITRDVQEAIDTLQRWQEMRKEECHADNAPLMDPTIEYQDQPVARRCSKSWSPHLDNGPCPLSEGHAGDCK